MKITLINLGAILICASASAAMAAEPVVAKLETPQKAQKVIAGGGIFTCGGDTCQSGPTGSDRFSNRGCRQLARTVGNIVSFSSGSKAFSAEKLAMCNNVKGK